MLAFDGLIHCRPSAEKAAAPLFTAGNALMDQELLPYEELLLLYVDVALKGLMPS